MILTNFSPFSSVQYVNGRYVRAQSSNRLFQYLIRKKPSEICALPINVVEISHQYFVHFRWQSSEYEAKLKANYCFLQISRSEIADRN